MDVKTTQEMWTRGDYSIVARWIADASLSCLEGVTELSNKKLLDVACGMGTVSIAAAQQGAKVTGVDITPNMLKKAAENAEQAGVSIELQEGSFQELSYRDFDVVTSAFGVIFSTDPVATAKGLVAACNSTGTIVLTAWDKEGVFGGFPKSVVELLPTEFQNRNTFGNWSDAEWLSSIFVDLGINSIALQKRSIFIPFPSTEDATKQMIEYSGPWQMIFDLFKAQDKEEIAASELTKHLSRFGAPTAEGIAIKADYVVVRMSKM